MNDGAIIRVQGNKKKASARVLIVDDDEASRLHLRALLLTRGYEVVEAADGQSALDIIAKEGADIVLLDVRMPGMDGIEVCWRIKHELGQFSLPIIIVTGMDDRNARLSGKESGADEFLTKPVDEMELLIRVRNLLQVKAYHELQERQRELLEAELSEIRHQLLHAERLATLGTLAGGVGHELKNLVTVFHLNMAKLRLDIESDQPPDTETVDSLNRVEQHLETHATQLLTSARPGPDYTEPVDFRDVVTGTMTMLRLTGKTKYVEVEVDLPPDPVIVRVNRTRIEQILINLVTNAADALEEAEGRTRCIRICVRHDPQNRRMRCSVEDNGCGIPDEQLEKIMEPYFTTKKPGRGTGLGLPVVSGILESYRGSLLIESTPGQGTTLTFDLPLCEKGQAGAET
jgi:C4-dicarboxylate-specific signal transduction histidine kinase